MARSFTSMSELLAEIKKKISEAVEMTRDDIYQTIMKNITDWYGAYSPTMYERTNKFADSLIKLDVSFSGNNISANVKIDDGFLGSAYSSGNRPTGLNVAQTAAEGGHGATGSGFMNVPGNVKFWTDALDKLGNEEGIKGLLIQNLKKCGL